MTEDDGMRVYECYGHVWTATIRTSVRHTGISMQPCEEYHVYYAKAYLRPAPLLVIHWTHLTSLEPSRNAVEMVAML